MPKVETLVDRGTTADRYDVANRSRKTLWFLPRTKILKHSTRRLTWHAKFVAQAAALYDRPPWRLWRILPRPDANLKVGSLNALSRTTGTADCPCWPMVTSPAAGHWPPEIAGAGNAASRMILGDGWWTAADKETGYAKRVKFRIAEKWYSAAVEGLTGGNKIKVEMRLKTLASLAPLPGQPDHQPFEIG